MKTAAEKSVNCLIFYTVIRVYWLPSDWSFLYTKIIIVIEFNKYMVYGHREKSY